MYSVPKELCIVSFRQSRDNGSDNQNDPEENTFCFRDNLIDEILNVLVYNRAVCLNLSSDIVIDVGLCEILEAQVGHGHFKGLDENIPWSAGYAELEARVGGQFHHQIHQFEVIALKLVQAINEETNLSSPKIPALCH